MRTLYHYPLDPASRQARIALAEKKLKVKLEFVDPWNPDPKFLEITPESAPPTLVDIIPGGTAVISGARAICEYANDGSPRHPLLPEDRLEKAEARRIAAWFDQKFSSEVNAYILHEKIEKSLTRAEPADPPTLRLGREHLQFHLSYFTWLLERRDWLGGQSFSLADIAGPTVQPLLKDRVPGLRPPRHYADLDF